MLITYPGDNLVIESGTYNETITFDKIMKIKARNGVATIGQKKQ